jgi:hypothetical protein
MVETDVISRTETRFTLISSLHGDLGRGRARRPAVAARGKWCSVAWGPTSRRSRRWAAAVSRTTDRTRHGPTSAGTNRRGRQGDARVRLEEATRGPSSGDGLAPPLVGAGRVEDRYNLLGHAARKLLEKTAKRTRQSREKICHAAGVRLLLAPSIKAGLDIDWSGLFLLRQIFSISVSSPRHTSSQLQEDKPQGTGQIRPVGDRSNPASHSRTGSCTSEGVRPASRSVASSSSCAVRT